MEEWGDSFIKGSNVIVKEEFKDLILNISLNKCQKSFRKLFDHFFPLLVKQGLRTGLNKEISSELAQETMLKVWANASTFDISKGNVSVWIYTISRNVRYDYFRKHSHDPLKASAIDLYSLDSQNTELKEDLESLFDIEILKGYLNYLPKEQREVMEKIYLKGYTQEEISNADNIPLGTVKSRVRLAISFIKEKLREV